MRIPRQLPREAPHTLLARPGGRGGSGCILKCRVGGLARRIHFVKTVLTTWLVLFSLLLQGGAWALPVQRAEQAVRLAHEVAHAIDHGHHQHSAPFEAFGHDLDASLLLDEPPGGERHGPHHTHASDGVQLQGLLLKAEMTSWHLPRSAPREWTPVQPLSADLAGLLRPPKTRS